MLERVFQDVRMAKMFERVRQDVVRRAPRCWNGVRQDFGRRATRYWKGKMLERQDIGKARSWNRVIQEVGIAPRCWNGVLQQVSRACTSTTLQAINTFENPAT
jgi:hypothetical protein